MQNAKSRSAQKVKKRTTTETLPVICNQCTVVGASDPQLSYGTTRRMCELHSAFSCVADSRMEKRMGQKHQQGTNERTEQGSRSRIFTRYHYVTSFLVMIVDDSYY